ncbi:MAG: haloacid dehalogenase [Armatimonadetes bacterium]|nr:haloacid dehalogenase [Armatimonadota bacterium]
MTRIDGEDRGLASVRQRMDGMHQVREQALRHCRSMIQTSAKCIRHVHRRQFAEAADLLAEARLTSAAARSEMEDFPELMYAGYLQDAEKELVEATVLLAWVGPDPTVDDGLASSVGPTSYLNGLGEAASECRRYVLDETRKGDQAEAERLLGRMEAVYDGLITFDYPDALTGGLRRTCDALRAVVERTRSDLTMTSVQRELMEELRHGRP